MESPGFQPLQKRKVKRTSIADRKVKLATCNAPAKIQDVPPHEQINHPEVDNAEDQLVEMCQKVQFENIDRVSFYIDGAVGLPANCTVTRVTARLLTQDRQQVTSLGSTESHSDPQSPCFSPSYDLFLSWKGKSNIPNFSVYHLSPPNSKRFGPLVNSPLSH
jgi:hypothetical protein